MKASVPLERLSRFMVPTLLAILASVTAHARSGHCAKRIRALAACGIVTLRNFDDSRLEGSDLRGLRAFGTRFRRADLRGVDFRDADLRRARFIEADLRGADLRTSPRHLRKAAWYRAVIDEFTQLPESWGETPLERVARAMSEGMIYRPTLSKPAEALAILENLHRCADSLGPLPLAGGISGKWRGELFDRAGTLEIQRFSPDLYVGRFDFEHGGMVHAFTLRPPADARPGARWTVEWRDELGGRGKGWLAVSSDLEALTGQIGFGSNDWGAGEFTFVRRD